jgi:hypothetical protein
MPLDPNQVDGGTEKVVQPKFRAFDIMPLL